MNQRASLAYQRPDTVYGIANEAEKEREKLIDVSGRNGDSKPADDNELVPIDVIEKTILDLPGDHEQQSNLEEDSPRQR